MAQAIDPITRPATSGRLRQAGKALITAGGIHAAAIRVATLLLLAAASAFVPHFTEFGNVQAILYSIAAVGVGAVGMGVVTINGNLFMLSMGATAAVSTVLFASFIHLGPAAAVALVAATGLGAGLVQGALIALAAANPIITTIAASSIISGIGVLCTGGLTVVGTGDASWLGSGQAVPWVPNQILVLAVFAAAVGFLLQRTRIGREIRLIGMQREVARVAGLRIAGAILVAYGLAGTAAALAGCLIASAAAQGNLTYGVDLDFNAIAAVLVGGISIRGGRGSVVDTVVGAAFLGVIGNILLVSGASYEYQLVAKGAVVLGAVVFGTLALRLAPRVRGLQARA